MKERPILFSAPMVRAILVGAKTQTRREFAPRGRGFIGCCCGGTAAHWVAEGDRWHCGTCGGGARLTARDIEYVRCPYGQPGDRIWVREAWQRHEGGPVYDAVGCVADEFESETIYRATRPHYPGPWRPSIHMPRWASRILLEVTDVRVERLQGISDDDCAAEGVYALQCNDLGAEVPYYRSLFGPCELYRMLWESINGPGGWCANPWVWVVGFRRVM